MSKNKKNKKFNKNMNPTEKNQPQDEEVLKNQEDAILLDNSGLTLEETAKAIMEICEKKWEVRRANV